MLLWLDYTRPVYLRRVPVHLDYSQASSFEANMCDLCFSHSGANFMLLWLDYSRPVAGTVLLDKIHL